VRAPVAIAAVEKRAERSRRLFCYVRLCLRCIATLYTRSLALHAVKRRVQRHSTLQLRTAVRCWRDTAAAVTAQQHTLAAAVAASTAAGQQSQHQQLQLQLKVARTEQHAVQAALSLQQDTARKVLD
jgi:hypothetical protein